MPGRFEDPDVLLVYFSRAGENYQHGKRKTLSVGHTEELARIIASQLPCDVYRIEPADPYPDDYDAAVERNVREQEVEARPEIANPLESIEQYTTILLASPIWNVRPPRIMRTFTDAHDFAGKTIYPVTTHGMSGLGDAPDEYAAACPGAVIGEGLAVRGEDAARAQDQVAVWLNTVLQGDENE